MELKLSGYSSDALLLNDAERMRRWFIELAELIGMTIVNGPNIYDFKKEGLPEAGLSGYVVIAESHMSSSIAAHSWPETSWVMCQVVSCKPFDTLLAAQFTQEHFGLKIPVVFKVDQSWGTRPWLEHRDVETLYLGANH
jgi:S-adenosylmethionine decarboxylase